MRWQDRHAVLQRQVNRRRATDAGQYPVKLEIELSQWDNLRALVEFLNYVRKAANSGHSFKLEADREEGHLPEFWDGEGHPTVFVDGDGSDHIGRITLNGGDVTE